MTATRTPAAMTVDAIRRRQRDPDPDPVQVRLDRDHLMGIGHFSKVDWCPGRFGAALTGLP